MSGFLGSGNWLFDRFDDTGASTGKVDMGNADKFAINEPSKPAERTSKQKLTYGQALDNVPLKSSSAISIVGNEVAPSQLAIGLLGASQTNTQASGTLTDQVVNVILDRWVDIGKSAIDAAGFVVKPNTGVSPPAYVEGTDYIVNRDLGLLMALSSGGIAAGPVKVSATYEAISSTIIQGGTKPVVRGAILFDGRNLATGKLCTVRIPLVTLAPTKELDFLSSSYMQIELAGTCLLTAGATVPYSVELRS